MRLPPQISALDRPLDEFLAIASEVADTNSGKFIDVDFLWDLVFQAQSHLRATIPTHQCPWCNGRGCQTCKATGMVPQQVWMRAPAELRGTEEES